MAECMNMADIPVSDFVVSRAVLSEEMLVEEVERWFHNQVGVESAVVLRATGEIAGMVYRRRFLHQLSGRFGHALFGQRPIVELMETAFLVVDASTCLPEVAAALSTRQNEHFYDDLVVKFFDGTYGTAPVRAILEALQTASAQLHTDLVTVRDENRKLQNQAEARWELISSLSHELKTPLSTISGYAELAELSLDNKARAKECLVKIREASSEMFGYINSVLEMARAAAGRLELSPERFDLRQEVEAASAQCSILTRGRSIRVSYQVPPGPVWVFLDRRKVRQVLVNLVGNAAKFTQAGSIEIRLKLGAGEAVASVTDTGPGIAQDQLAQLFHKFERVGDRTVEGSGLGLSIVKALVEAQGGQVSVTSVVNQGSVFTVVYPLMNEEVV
jgi:signal transduction histidine kinase